MLYSCYHCDRYYCLDKCPRCSDEHAEEYVPLDPKYYPEFQYVTQGLVKDLLFKKKKQEELNSVLDSVLEKYSAFKHPYFVNYLLIARRYDIGHPQEDLSYSRLALFHNVLLRLGFNQLNEFEKLTEKLIRSTEFDFYY